LPIAIYNKKSFLKPKSTNLMRYILLIASFLFCAHITQAQQSDSTTQVLKVGVKQTPPFIIKNSDGRHSGISIALWEKMASSLGYEYEYKEYSLEGLLDALQKGEVDVCINPLTVTSSRVEQFDFTQPFFITNLAIAVDKSGQSKWVAFVKNFFSIQFFKAILLLLLVLMIFGLLVWFFEKGKNKDEFASGIRGLWDGLWWSAVTMTTVGYGDKSPQTTGGRIVALIWMFTAIIIISGFTASIASSLTVSELQTSIKSPKDLKKVRVAAVKASTGAEYLQKNAIDHSLVDNIDEALAQLNAMEVDAVVYDEPIMRFTINKKEFEKVVILPFKFATQYYSFALPKGNDRLDRLNPILLREIGGVEFKAELQEYNLE